MYLNLGSKKLLGDYHIGKTIGQGAFSKVKIGFHKETNQKVAIKVIDKKMIAEKAEKAKKEAEREKKKRHRPKTTEKVIVQEEDLVILNNTPTFISNLQLEVQLLMRLDHPNVIRLYQIMETDDECYVVMEYAAGGELMDHITKKDRLSEKDARKFFRQLISAMDHCHKANVVHRDLKLENLLLNADGELLISDFGLGRMFKDDKTELMNTFCGTPNYAAVELISGIPYIGVKSDIWAMGVVLYVMCTGRPPFSGSNLNALYAKIKAVDYKCPEYFSKGLRRLFAKILVKDPNRRITMEELRKDSWVNHDEDSLPLQILPKIVGNPSPSQCAQFISGITSTGNAVIYTLHKHNESRSLKSPVTPQVFQRRQNSVKANTSGAHEEVEESGEISPLRNDPTSGIVKHIRSLSIGGNSDAKRSRSITTTPPNFTTQTSKSDEICRRRAASTGAADRNNTIMRRMTMVVPAKQQIALEYLANSIVSDTKKPVLNMSRRASMIPHSSATTPVSPSSSATGSKIVKLPSLPIVADDLDPFDGDDNLEITQQEILDWHSINRPPKEIRTVRFSFNPATTSDLAPAIFFHEIYRAIMGLQVRYLGLMFKRVDEYYMFNCSYRYSDEQEPVSFEIELCKIWLLKVHGVRIKRLGGDPFIYKDLHNNFIAELDLNK